MTNKQLLDEMAYRFEVYASDQIACRRFHATAKAKRDCDIKAEIWRDAASELRIVRDELDQS